MESLRLITFFHKETISEARRNANPLLEQGVTQTRTHNQIFSKKALKMFLGADPCASDVSKGYYLNAIPAVHNVFSENDDLWGKAPRKST